MRRVFPQVVLSSAHAIAARSTFRPSRILHKLARTLAINLLFAAVSNVFASPYVEFDIGPTAECRDVTPAQRLTLYPSQRVIEVALPVSVRFHGASMEDVEELARESPTGRTLRKARAQPIRGRVELSREPARVTCAEGS